MKSHIISGINIMNEGHDHRLGHSNQQVAIESTEMRDGKPVIRYFVSYAHDDKDLKDKLLKPLKQRLAIAKDYCFEAWDDGEILAGERWHEQIQAAVARCQFGLLLVTPAFLGSEYIQNHELLAFVTSNLTDPEPEKRAIPVALKRIPFDKSIDLKGLEQVQVFQDSVGKAFEDRVNRRTRDGFASELFQQILKIVKRYGAHPHSTESEPRGIGRNDDHGLNEHTILNSDNPDLHYRYVLNAISRSQIVPFLGADINLCSRPSAIADPKPKSWKPEKKRYPPSNKELALHLDRKLGKCFTKDGCPLIDSTDLPTECFIQEESITKLPLQCVSQYAKVSGKLLELNAALSEVFCVEYSLNPIHRFLASLPTLMKEKGYAPPYPLIMTACFDRTLEQAFENAEQPFDLLYFEKGKDSGRFELRSPEGKVSDPPRTKEDSYLQKRPVILKLYGGYTKESEKYVITEDDYLEYLAKQSFDKIMPRTFLNKLRTGILWFLGYNPSYWNLRIILHRILENFSTIGETWVAVQANPEDVDEQHWNEYKVTLCKVTSLENYIAELESRLRRKEEPKKPNGETVRDRVFISYSHKDLEWLEKLQKQLKSAVRNEEILLWCDTMIESGNEWREKIKNDLAVAKVAVLLASVDFLVSKFIDEEELPPLLEAAEKEGLGIIWILLSDCNWKEAGFSKYQAAYDLSKPLDHLERPLQMTALRKISEKILEAMKS